MILYRLVETLVLVVTLSQVVRAEILKFTTHVDTHYRKAIGSEHIKGVFPSPGLFVTSIDHARRAFARKTKGILDTSDQDHFVGCVEYSKVSPALQFLKDNRIDYHVSYTSASDNLLCLYLFLTPADIESVERSKMVMFTMLEPVPALIKLDKSVHQLQYDFLSPVDEEISQVEATSVSMDEIHPIISDLLSGTKSTLSVMVRPQTSIGVQETLVESWLRSMQSVGKTTKSLQSEENFASHIFWANQVDPSEFHKVVNASSAPRFHRTSSIATASQDSVKRNRYSSTFPNQRNRKLLKAKQPLSATEEVHLAIRRGAWRSWARTLEHLHQEELHEALCGMENIQVRHHKDNIVFSLPEQMLAMSSAKFHSGGVRHHLKRGDTGNDDHQTVKVGGKAFTHQEIAGACFAQLISVISADPLVTRVALSRPMQTLNNLARQITQFGALGSESFSALGLDGTGVVIGISDTGIDETSCYFRDADNGHVPRSSIEHPVVDTKYRKVIQYIAYSGSGGDYPGGHGSHVAGTVAGNCDYESNNNAHNDFKGMASGAKIAFFDIGMNDKDHDLAIPNDLASDIFSTAHAAGAHIHSNSWGGGYLYDAFTLATDAFLYEQEDFLAIFAAGNSGTSGAYTVNSPALSKNCLAVACSNTGHSTSSNIDHISQFSSHGPALDGRIKPDITAPGSYLTSALARAEGSTGTSCATTSKSGTSMATPVVAGTAGLILQYFQDSKFWAKLCDPRCALCSGGAFTPSGVLLKALLLQSGKGVTGYDGSAMSLSNLPDTYQGFGRVNLLSLLPTLAYSNSKAPFTLYVDQAQLPELSEQSYSVQVLSASHALKVTLSWFDPPNEVFAARFLLHDLDLILEDPTGRIFFGNAPVSNGAPALGSQRDELNNNEQITIAAPALGMWTVRVQTKRLTQATIQKFAVVITSKGTVASNPEVTTLSPSILEECHLSTGTPVTTPQVSLEVSKFAKLAGSGWSAQDQYHIVSSEVEAGFDQAGTFTSNHPYETDRVCVPAGCYTAHLNIASTASKKGSQMSIPECNVYLTPMSPQQSFCVEPSAAFREGSSSVPVFASNACLSSCEMQDHMMLPLYMGEYYEGAGWGGTYYTLQRYFPADPPAEFTPSFETSTAGSGSMDWGFEEISEHCLPGVDACYALQLSIPSIVVDQDMEYPVLFIMNTVLPGTNIECPFELNTTVTLAKFCVTATDSEATSVITFYEQTRAVYDLGQTKTTWSEFANTQNVDRIKAIGTCTGIMPLVPRTVISNEFDLSDAPSKSPSVSPSTLPSKLPTTAPSVVPTFDPTVAPTVVPSSGPTGTPTSNPTVMPGAPTATPTIEPSSVPTFTVTQTPSAGPTLTPTVVPTCTPSAGPSVTPTVIGTMPPSVPPSAQPSAQPTVPFAQSMLAIYGNHNFDCISDCAGYPGFSGLVNDMESTCYFLLDIFHLCSTYSVAYGLCEVPACATDCTQADWCYFGGGTVVSCPDLGEWMGLSDDAARIADQCVVSLNATAHGTADDDEASEVNADGEASAGVSASTKAVIIVSVILVAVAGIVGVCFCVTAMRKTDAHSPLPSESAHGLFASGDSEHGIAAGGNDTSSRAAAPSGLSAEKVKSLLAQSANYLRGRTARPRAAASTRAAGRTASSSSSSSSTAKGGSNQDSSGTRGGYEMVSSPFSIGVHEDDEEGGADSDTLGDDIRV